jgi:two-component system sensor histidine kinase BaeS
VGIVAHELRTPLTALRGYLQMLSRSSPETDGRLVPLAAEQADRLQRLVDELFDVTRVERGRFTIEREPVGLRAVLEQTIEIAQGVTERHEIRFEAANGEIVAAVDRGRIQQVVLNLLMNAIVHAPNSPTIAVRLRRLRRRAEIEVEDRGPGISAEHQKMLFSPFEQVASGRQVGLGLGLYIAREIVLAHGGTIEVDSAPGEGTTFTVRLPLQPPPEPDSRGAGRDETDGRMTDDVAAAADPPAKAGSRSRGAREKRGSAKGRSD